MVPDGFPFAGRVDDHEVGRIPFRQREIGDAEGLGRIGRYQVVQDLHVVEGRHPHEVGRQERDLQHVVPAEGIVGVGDVVLSERHGDAGRVKVLHPGVQGSGLRIAHQANPRDLQQMLYLPVVGLGIQGHRPRVLHGDPAFPTFLDRLLCQHLHGPQARVARVVQEHGDVLAELHREREHAVHVVLHVLLGIFDPRDAADHVRAQLQRLAHPTLRARIARDAVLGEGDDLHGHPVLVFLARLDEGLHALQLRLGVHVGERPDVRVAELHREVQGLADILDDPLLVVAFLDLGRLLYGGHRAAHGTARVGRKGGHSDLLQGIHLVQVQVAVDEGLAYEAAGGVEDLRGAFLDVRRDPGDPAARDRHIHALAGRSPRNGVPDQNIVGHLFLLFCRRCENETMEASLPSLPVGMAAGVPRERSPCGKRPRGPRR